MDLVVGGLKVLPIAEIVLDVVEFGQVEFVHRLLLVVDRSEWQCENAREAG